MEVGDIVIVKRSFLNNQPNLRGYVYDTYQDLDHPIKEGACIILENGRDLGGFSYKEQCAFTVNLGNSGIGYRFKNVIKLAQDFETLIAPAFETIEINK